MRTGNKITSRLELLMASLLMMGAACSSGSESGGGGSTSSGSSGSAGSGAASSSRGGSGAGGSSASSSSSPSGGSSATSSSSKAGGSLATGGSSTSGGSTATGGSNQGGSGAGGDATGGTRTTTGTGGTAGRTTGGTGTGGTTGTGGSSAKDGGVANDGGGDNDGGVAGQACASSLAAVTDYSATGPFATTTENNTGPNKKSVIYRPKTLGENGFLHAPIIFGPGIGMQATQLSGLLTSFASHGYVVVGTDVLNGGPNDPGNLKTMRDTLNWIIQQNDADGTYKGKLATKCAISMGYSVGGTAAVELGAEAAIATTVSIHGHTASSAMHGPLLQTSGDKDTVGRPMQQKTFDSSKVQTFFGTVSNADHGYIQNATGGVQRPAIIAWMRYWINGDTGAKKYFWGDSCVCCTSPWMEPKRKNWE